jgi:biopolymer transport protein ExbB
MLRKLLIGLAAGAALNSPALAWWNEAWTTRTEVRLDTSAKGLTLPAALADVVLPLRLHSGNFDFAAVQPDGSDLRVIGADDKTALPFEIERFDPINELALIWVRVPTVAQGSDKNLLHVYAGNDKAPAEPRPPVYAQGYAAVLHFSEADGPAIDAAGGLKTSSSPARETNGLLGGALRMVGVPIELPLPGA